MIVAAAFGMPGSFFGQSLEVASLTLPPYPRLMLIARLEGDLHLRARVSTDGSVAVVDWLSTDSPHAGFERLLRSGRVAIDEAIGSWRVKSELNSDIDITLRYRLGGSDASGEPCPLFKHCGSGFSVYQSATGIILTINALPLPLMY